MNEFKGTPGPWMLTREWVEDGDGSEVEFFSVKGPGEDDLILEQPIDTDDARLIAAAPELLDSLIALFNFMGTVRGVSPDLLLAYHDARKVIEKALGK